MKHVSHIERVEARARALGLKPSAVYREAGVARATLWRWRHGKTDPRMAAFDDALGRITAVLDRKETEGAQA